MRRFRIVEKPSGSYPFKVQAKNSWWPFWYQVDYWQDLPTSQRNVAALEAQEKRRARGDIVHVNEVTTAGALTGFATGRVSSQTTGAGVTIVFAATST